MKGTKPNSSKPAVRKTAAKIPAKIRGNMKPAEIQPLVMAARAAWSVQDPGIPFDDWRGEQVMEAVARPGLTACDSKHFCALMGHFKMAAGLEEEALHWFLRDGKNAERQLAYSIAEALTAHVALAHATVEQITETTPPRFRVRRLARHAAILDHPEGPLSFDYLLAIVRMKTRRPDLTLGADLKVSLAERCDLGQLIQIRNTLVNRISEREGVGHTSDRNKSQNSPAAKQRRSPDFVAPRF